MEVLSELILILLGICPVVLLSIFAFLCVATWWHDENVDCPHLYHVIMGSYTLFVEVLKYFLILGGFIRLDSDPLGLLSCGAFVHSCFSLYLNVMAWRECWLSTPVSCDHGIVHLDCWSLKIFSHFGGFYPPWFWSFGAFVLWCFCPFCFSLCSHLMAWRECWLSTPVLCDHGIVHLNCWSLKIFSHFWGFCPPWFWSFNCWCCPVVLSSIFAFLFSATWWHDENVDCPHLYHVIMGSYTLFVEVLKYFLIFRGFVRLDSDPLGLLSCFAFVHFCFPLDSHVIKWRECWLSTPVSCDHGIVHFDCWSLKIFSHFWGFCPPWFWSFGAFVLWCFYPFLLFSVRPRDGMTRMLIVQTCIMWSWDRTPWLLESWNIFLFLGVLSALILIL